MTAEKCGRTAAVVVCEEHARVAVRCRTRVEYSTCTMWTCQGHSRGTVSSLRLEWLPVVEPKVDTIPQTLISKYHHLDFLEHLKLTTWKQAEMVACLLTTYQDDVAFCTCERVDHSGTCVCCYVDSRALSPGKKRLKDPHTMTYMPLGMMGLVLNRRKRRRVQWSASDYRRVVTFISRSF